MMLELLKSKFGDCKFAVRSLCGNKTSYENTSVDVFYIYDPPNEENQPVRIVNLDQDYQLIVKNPNETEICVVKTDKCLFKDDHMKCDCILFNGDKCFLVEIKSSGTKKRREQRHIAAEQLERTLLILKENGIYFGDVEVKAVTCFKTPNVFPIQASRLSLRASFFEEYKVLLDEGNKIEF